MIGIWPPNISTTLIWSIILKVSLILMALNSLKLSAQSPPCNKKAFPIAASASLSSNLLASPAKTIGGNASIVFKTDWSSLASRYSGSCNAFFVFQLSKDHFPVPGAAYSFTATEFLVGSAATAEIERWDFDMWVLFPGTKEKVGGCCWFCLRRLLALL